MAPAGPSSREPVISDDSGSESTDSREDEEGWDDVEPDEDDEAAQEVISLLDERVFPDVESMLAHCRDQHGFDFLAVRQRLQLDFHGSVKLVNFGRYPPFFSRLNFFLFLSLPVPLNIRHHAHEEASLGDIIIIILLRFTNVDEGSEICIRAGMRTKSLLQLINILTCVPTRSCLYPLAHNIIFMRHFQNPPDSTPLPPLNHYYMN